MRHSLYTLERYQTIAGQVLLNASGDSFDYYDYDKDPQGKKKKALFHEYSKIFQEFGAAIQHTQMLIAADNNALPESWNFLQIYLFTQHHKAQLHELEPKLNKYMQQIWLDEKFVKDNPPPPEALIEPVEPDGAAAGGPHKPSPAPAPEPLKFGVVDPVRQQQFDQMVAQIMQIDIEISKGRAVRKKDYLKGCFNEVLQEVKSHEAELLNHNLDVPGCLRKSGFIQQCTHLNADTDLDTFTKALCLLGDAEFDAIIR